ncbi:MAG: FtsQ-type POTRA domain-containing protein [Clostridiales bacterium]|nr:FtsQ-type POTRA domain-containing protein [Clostridiales bacterium]
MDTGNVRGPLALLAVLALLVCAVLLGWDAFAIRSVTITGYKNLTYDELLALSGVRTDENLFMLDPRLVASRLESNPFVDVLSVERVYPDTVAIEIFERSPRAAVEVIEGYAVIGEEDIVLSVSGSLPAGHCPVVKGLPLNRWDPGTTLDSGESERIKIMDQLLRAVYDTGAVHWIGEIDLSDLQNIVILSEEGILILVGELKSLDEKFKLLDQIMPSIRQEGYTAGKIYLTADSVNFVPTTANPE